jgi:hypothetical protein
MDSINLVVWANSQKFPVKLPKHLVYFSPEKSPRSMPFNIFLPAKTGQCSIGIDEESIEILTG